MKLKEIDNQTLIDELKNRMNRMEGYLNETLIYELRKREMDGLLSDDDYQRMFDIIENSEVIENLTEKSYDEGLADGEKTSRKITDEKTMKQAFTAACEYADNYSCCDRYAADITTILYENLDEGNFVNLVLEMILKTDQSIVLEQIFNVNFDSQWKLDQLKQFAQSLKHQ